MDTNIKFQKSSIRKFLLDRRNQLSSNYEEKNHSHIHIKTLIEDTGKCKIGSYLPFRNEISTKLIHELFFSMDFEIGLPHLNDLDKNMTFRNWKIKDELI